VCRGDGVKVKSTRSGEAAPWLVLGHEIKTSIQRGCSFLSLEIVTHIECIDTGDCQQNDSLTGVTTELFDRSLHNLASVRDVDSCQVRIDFKRKSRNTLVLEAIEHSK
jgi:hypothetical protein